MTDRDVYLVSNGPYAPIGGVMPDFAYSRAAELYQMLLDVGPCIVMPNWIWSAFGVCERARLRMPEMRVVAHCRSDDDNTYYDPLTRRQHQFDRVIAVSEVCADTLSHRLFDGGSRVAVLRTFVNRPASLGDRTWGADPIRILWAGRIESAIKRVEDAVEVAVALLDRDVDFTLTIAGTGPAMPALLSQMAMTGHAGRIRVTGEIRPTDMARLYAQSDVLLMTSDTEGLSNTLVEAMAYGCVPVVTRTRSGVDGVVPQTIASLAAAPGDIDALANSIAALSQSPIEIARLGRLAHKGTTDYSWEAFRIRFSELLADVERSPTRNN